MVDLLAPGPHRLFIGGEFVEGSNGTYDVINPSTEEVVGHPPDASAADAAAAAAAAADAFPAWSGTRPEERAALLERLADLLDEHADEFVPVTQAETGATLRVTETMQIPTASQRFRRYARGALEPVELPVPPTMAEASALAPAGLVGGLAVRQPVGVVVAIASYNFPLTNMAGKLAPALAMGNTVVVKPAPQDPLGIIKLMDLVRQAGFPPGVVNLIVGSTPESVEALVESDHVDMVSFTGSTEVGRLIGEAAGRDIKRLLLELGGKGASLIFDDADLSAAIPATGSTWAFHSGQICTAPTRVLAQRGVYDQVVEGLAGFAAVLKVGDPKEADTVVGPVITEAHRGRIEGYIDSGREDGATVVAGGERPDHPETGWYVPPTLLADCRHDMRCVQEEIFGPVVVVVAFDDDDEGIELANGTSFGLYDYVWTGDSSRGMRVARRLRSGNVGIGTAQRNFELPFGGFKKSGVGRDGGSHGLWAYSELQAITWPG